MKPEATPAEKPASRSSNASKQNKLIPGKLPDTLFQQCPLDSLDVIDKETFQTLIKRSLNAKEVDKLLKLEEIDKKVSHVMGHLLVEIKV